MTVRLRLAPGLAVEFPEGSQLRKTGNLTAKQVAELFQLNVDSVYDLVGSEQMPATKLGGRWRFDESELRDWFKNSRLHVSNKERRGTGADINPIFDKASSSPCPVTFHDASGVGRNSQGSLVGGASSGAAGR